MYLKRQRQTTNREYFSEEQAIVFHHMHRRCERFHRNGRNNNRKATGIGFTKYDRKVRPERFISYRLTRERNLAFQRCHLSFTITEAEKYFRC